MPRTMPSVEFGPRVPNERAPAENRDLCHDQPPPPATSPEVTDSEEGCTVIFKTSPWRSCISIGCSCPSSDREYALSDSVGSLGRLGAQQGRQQRNALNTETKSKNAMVRFSRAEAIFTASSWTWSARGSSEKISRRSISASANATMALPSGTPQIAIALSKRSVGFRPLRVRAARSPHPRPML
jgi:hypothetical protein